MDRSEFGSIMKYKKTCFVNDKNGNFSQNAFTSTGFYSDYLVSTIYKYRERSEYINVYAAVIR